MTEQTTEPSMEEILSSIRRILSSEDENKENTENAKSYADDNVPEAGQPQDLSNVMELTPDMLSEQKMPNIPTLKEASDVELLSRATIQASTDRLNDLTAHLINDSKEKMAPPPPALQPSNNASLEELVSSLIRPYLKEWLDAHLPEMVERIVSKEVERLTQNIS